MRRFVLAAGLGVLFTAMTSRPALALDDRPLRVQVPFSFHIANSTFPPGNYVISSTEGVDPSVLEIRKDDGHASAFFLTQSAATDVKAKDARLVFDQYGQERFLHAILVPGETGNEILVSTLETKVAIAEARAEAEKTAVTRAGD